MYLSYVDCVFLSPWHFQWHPLSFRKSSVTDFRGKKKGQKRSPGQCHWHSWSDPLCHLWVRVYTDYDTVPPLCVEVKTSKESIHFKALHLQYIHGLCLFRDCTSHIHPFSPSQTLLHWYNRRTPWLVRFLSLWPHLSHISDITFSSPPSIPLTHQCFYSGSHPRLSSAQTIVTPFFSFLNCDWCKTLSPAVLPELPSFVLKYQGPYSQRILRLKVVLSDVIFPWWQKTYFQSVLGLKSSYGEKLLIGVRRTSVLTFSFL